MLRTAPQGRDTAWSRKQGFAVIYSSSSTVQLEHVPGTRAAQGTAGVAVGRTVLAAATE